MLYEGCVPIPKLGPDPMQLFLSLLHGHCTEYYYTDAPFHVSSLIKPQHTMFNYTYNWEFKELFDILFDRVPVLVLFGILYAQLCPT